MFLGVPYVPFFVSVSIPLLFSMYFNLFFLLGVPVVIMILREIAKYDDMIFRLWGLNLRFFFSIRNRYIHKGLNVLNPNLYRNK